MTQNTEDVQDSAAMADTIKRLTDTTYMLPHSAFKRCTMASSRSQDVEVLRSSRRERSREKHASNTSLLLMYLW